MLLFCIGGEFEELKKAFEGKNIRDRFCVSETEGNGGLKSRSPEEMRKKHSVPTNQLTQYLFRSCCRRGFTQATPSACALI